MNRRAAALLLGFGLAVATTAAVGARLPDRTHVLVVGSSTTYPIVAAAAEFIARRDGIITPVIESTGTGGGINLFCGGYGLDTPDVVMASRRMTETERNACIANQVNDVREIRLGYDGIVIANAKTAANYALEPSDLYLAIARRVPSPDGGQGLVDNPYHSWRQISDHLPDMPIRVLGPPPTSGTRDVFIERVMKQACLEVPLMQSMYERDPDAFAQSCYALREDGAYVNSGENDARLVRRLLADPQALGILGFNFVDRNRDRLMAASIAGIAPTFDAIESGVYPLSRPLFVYVKPAHSRFVSGLDHFVDALISDAVSGPEGVLVDHGLIPLKPGERAANRPSD
jgi:phosphate transport system substrate-binding protein